MRRWATVTSVIVITLTTAVVSTGASASPARTARARVKPGSTWTLEAGTQCESDAFAAHHRFSAGVSDGSGDRGTVRGTGKLKMTWTAGASAGAVFRGSFQRSTGHYLGTFGMPGHTVAATLVPGTVPGCATAAVTTTPASATISLGASDTDTATVTGNGGVTPTGTVTFWACAGTTGPCTSNSSGAMSLGAVAVSGAGVTATATSAGYTPPATGGYCFGADYSGDGHYGPGSDSDAVLTDECFSVTAPSPPVDLGSPENSFGTGDLPLGAGAPSNIWAAVNGYCSSKENGDEYLSAFDATFTGSTYSCSADQSETTPHAAANYEYNPAGYTYDIVTPHPAGILDSDITVQAYDPSYNPSGCGGAGETPDNSLGQPTTAITTNFTLSYAPQPSDPGQDETLNTFTAGTNNPTTCGQWVTIGVIDAGAPDGTYQLQVATQAGQVNSAGTNAYGLRVFQGPSFVRCSSIISPGWANPLADDCPVIHGQSALSVYANDNSASGTFYLAQIPASDAGGTMTVDLFDPGEGDKDIELIDPDGTGVPFSWATSDDVTSSPPCPDCAPDLGFLHYAGPDTTELDVSGTITRPPGQASSSQFNDRHVQLTVAIPPDYDALNGGWWQIRYIANPGQSISDRTTWSVAVAPPS
jgi:hypothetical protein